MHLHPNVFETSLITDVIEKLSMVSASIAIIDTINDYFKTLLHP